MFFSHFKSILMMIMLIHLKKIARKYAETKKGRDELEYDMKEALSGRETLWNALLKEYRQLMNYIRNVTEK